MKNLLRIAASVAVSLSISSAFAAPTIRVLPTDTPRYMEPVYLRLTDSGVCLLNLRASMSGTNITVTYDVNYDLCVPSYDVMLGRFPSGTYTVTVGAETRQFTVRAAPASASTPPVSYTDLWWNPAESGWGMSINQGPVNDLFVVWYVYDASGKPTWYTMQPGQWDTSWIYSGPVFKTSGPYFGGVFDPGQVIETQVGTATLSFRDFNHGEFRYTIDGVLGVKQVQRMPIE